MMRTTKSSPEATQVTQALDELGVIMHMTALELSTCERPASRGKSGPAFVSCWSCTEQGKLTGCIVEELEVILVLHLPTLCWYDTLPVGEI